MTGTRSGFTWTPAFITYGDNNRTQMIRTPEPGHVEDRTVSSAFNPYLAFAAYLAAGLDGIRRRSTPASPTATTPTRWAWRRWPAAASACCRRACPRRSTSWSATR